MSSDKGKILGGRPTGQGWRLFWGYNDPPRLPAWLCPLCASSILSVLWAEHAQSRQVFHIYSECRLCFGVKATEGAKRLSDLSLVSEACETRFLCLYRSGRPLPPPDSTSLKFNRNNLSLGEEQELTNWLNKQPLATNSLTFHQVTETKKDWSHGKGGL